MYLCTGVCTKSIHIYKLVDKSSRWRERDSRARVCVERQKKTNRSEAHGGENEMKNNDTDVFCIIQNRNYNNLS